MSRITGAVLVCAFVLVAALAPLLSPYDPVSADFANVLSPPARAHPFGTDDIGRDILSRVVYGSRISLQAGLFTVAVPGPMSAHQDLSDADLVVASLAALTLDDLGARVAARARS